MRNNRLILVAIVFIGLLNFPILRFFDSPMSFLGIPVIYLYFLAVWLGAIICTGIILNRKSK
ncbi:hypothetical protein [Aquirufa sp. 5-AUSEE-100C1]